MSTLKTLKDSSPDGATRAAPGDDSPVSSAAPPSNNEGRADEGRGEPSRLGTLARSGLSSLGWGLVGAAVVAALWQIGATAAPGVPKPGESFGKFFDLVSDPFYNNGPNDKGIGLQLLISLQRVFTGFAIAAMIGVPLGLMMGSSRRMWKAANPIVQFLRPVSPLAWFPIWLVAFKDGGKASVFVIFITALWPTVLNTAAGAAGIPSDQRDVARVFRFGRPAYFRHVLLPNALPSIVTGLRLSMGIAWMVIVAVEMLAGGAGIGFFVWDSYNASNMPAVIASLLIIGAVGFALDAVFMRLAAKVAIEEVRS
ncbi:MAG: nitrate ABC transporter permease [Acidimicrobiales bacterium]